MKKNFIVSLNDKAKIVDATVYFFSDEAIHHNYFSKNINSKIKIEVASSLWDNEEALQTANLFVEEKYNKYLKILSEKLNFIHNKNYDLIFWKKALSLSLVRYISILYQTYEVCEKNFDTDNYTCKILSRNSYLIPKDFNQFRDIFQYTSFGNEQLFSIYINLFYNINYENYEDNLNISSTDAIVRSSFFKSFYNYLFFKGKYFLKYLLRRKIFKKNKIKIGILGTLFDPQKVDYLVKNSDGKIFTIPLPDNFIKYNYTNNKFRDYLSIEVECVDKFDKYFYKSLQFCFPKDFVENYEAIETKYFNYFQNFPNLKHVISEIWIGDTYTSIALAILQRKKVSHLYNEHNCLNHQLVGNNLKYIYPIVDKFLSLGWVNDSKENHLKSGSLFKWDDNSLNTLKNIKVLFIDGIALVKRPEFNAGYGDSGSGFAMNYFNFTNLFFNNLSDNILNNIIYKPYPVESWPVMSFEKEQFIFYDFSKKLNLENRGIRLNDEGTILQNSKTLMKKSNLVIINYLSTSYIEAILMDIPTIFFWNKKNYFLMEEYGDFYNELVNVGICQTDPIIAANFISKIWDSPEIWWNTDSVKQARLNFISKNIGDSSILSNYLLNLL